jgi:hypothetical protein
MLERTAPARPMTTVSANAIPDCTLVILKGMRNASIVTAKLLVVPNTHIIEKNSRT